MPDNIEDALGRLGTYNKTSTRVIRGQLETVEGDAVNDVKRILSAVIEEKLRDCEGIVQRAASCNSIANELDKAIVFEEYEVENGLQYELPLGVKSALESVSAALRMASRTNTRSAAQKNRASR